MRLTLDYKNDFIKHPYLEHGTQENIPMKLPEWLYERESLEEQELLIDGSSAYYPDNVLDSCRQFIIGIEMDALTSGLRKIFT